MPPKKTPHQIKQEIRALKKLKPIAGTFAEKTARTIAIQISALEGKIKEGSPEYHDLSGDLQEAMSDALAWRDGLTSWLPSRDWDNLAK